MNYYWCLTMMSLSSHTHTDIRRDAPSRGRRVSPAAAPLGRQHPAARRSSPIHSACPCTCPSSRGRSLKHTRRKWKTVVLSGQSETEILFGVRGRGEWDEQPISTKTPAAGKEELMELGGKQTAGIKLN